MEFWAYPLLILLGSVCGFMNVVAGGGSLISLPVLIFLGLPSAVANGTNRVAIMVQNVSAVAAFKKDGFSDWRFSMMLAMPAVAGAAVGAYVAVEMTDELFKKVLGGVMLLVLGLILWGPKAKGGDGFSLTRGRKAAAAAAFFFVGVYGGFIQAGVGFIIMATLTSITGMSLVRVNSHKVFVVGVYTVMALAVFAWEGKIDWLMSLPLSVGTAIGGWLASRWQVKAGDRRVRIVLTVCVLALAAKLFGVLDWVGL